MEYNKLQSWEQSEVLTEVMSMYPEEAKDVLQKTLQDANPSVWYNQDNEQWNLWDANRVRFEITLKKRKETPSGE